MSPNVPWLTLTIVLPLCGMVLLQLIPGKQSTLLKVITVLTTAVTAGIVAAIVATLGTAPAASGPLGLKYQEIHEWIPAIGSTYHIGVDGIAGWFLALNAAVFLLASLVISRKKTERLKFFCGLLLLTEAATTGVVVSVDLVLFYLFWEAMLIPLYFLLSNYGDATRGKAALKFVIYTVAGSLAMLVAIIYLYFQAGQGSFDLQVIMGNAGLAQDRLVIPLLNVPTITPYQLAFLAFALAFAIKVPLIPFHTWLPNLYEACPSAVLVFFAGIVSKLGIFGFIRYCLTLFPQQMHQFQWLLIALALGSILYGAIMALGEVNIKRIVAYASMSHLGFIALGVFTLNSAGLSGAVLQVINHGIIIAALFLTVGMIETRLKTRDRHEIAGLEKRMPYLYATFLVITLASLGMPGMGTFAGEFTIMLGAFSVQWFVAAVAGIGVILACWYMLRLHQGLMQEPLSAKAETVIDLRWYELLTLAPLVALMVFLGLYPKPITDVTQPAISHYVTTADVSSGAGVR